ncbi:MAG: AAA family ATPase [bacterium]
MADLLRIRAVKQDDGGLSWKFEDESMVGYRIEVDVQPEMGVQDGDLWQATVVKKHDTPRNNRRVELSLLVRDRVQQEYERIDRLPGFWMPENDLKSALVWLSHGINIILIGDKGTGKTTFPTILAEAMGWQVPCKVGIGSYKRAEQVFGSNRGKGGGETEFAKSYLLEYLERAMAAYRQGLQTKFLVILDEWNRAHAKVKSPLHGCFDKTRQVTIPTEEGSRLVIIPPNVAFIATVNIGAENAGTFAMDDADKSRFLPIRMQCMPEPFEVALLVKDTGIPESGALVLVRVANILRRAAAGRTISYAPSYREVEATGILAKSGCFDLKSAVVQGMMGYYDGERKEENGEPVLPNSDFGKAFKAIHMQAVSGDLKELAKE